MIHDIAPSRGFLTVLRVTLREFLDRLLSLSFKTSKSVFFPLTTSNAMQQILLSTSDFAAAIGVSESSVRRMADSGELQIHRTRGGHRRIPATEAIRYVRENNVTIVRPDLLGIDEAVNQFADDDFGANLTAALTDGHARSVIGLMQAMYAHGLSIAEICDGPIHQAMTSIGNFWPDKRAIFIEHRATILCVLALCQIRLSIPDPDANAPTAMGAAPDGDPFLLPSLMVSLVLHECGFDETNLGPNTPIDVLTDVVGDEKPSIVWLAMTNAIRSRVQDREISRLATVITQYGGTFLIGGRSAGTFEGEGAVRCGTMKELSNLAIEVINR